MSRRTDPALALGLSGLALLLALTLAPALSSAGGFRADRLDLHLPRALLGALAGSGLALSGVVLQAVLRNPLASPYTLGVASGAAVGATLAVQLVRLGVLPSTVELPGSTVGALLGALGTSALVYTVAVSRELAAETLLLAGAAVALFSGAAVTVLHSLSDTVDLFRMVRWSMGSLSTAGYQRVGLAFPFVAAGVALLATVYRQLEVAALDDDSARALGVDPVAIRRRVFLGTSLITAGVVAVAGPVGFVGLVVPHLVRLRLGPDPRLLLPCSALLGGAFLIGCDVIARRALYPTELPINVITHAIGCPVFVWILLKRR